MWWIASAMAEPETLDLGGPSGLGGEAVVGGEPAAPGAWPDVVGIAYDGSIVGCTGTLISPDAVLTAGHCAGGITHVVVGTTDWAEGGDWIPVAAVFEHPDAETTFDVTVLKLSRRASAPPRALAMDCVIDEHLADGAAIAVVGYGATDEAGRVHTTELHEATTEVVDADCSEDEVNGWESGCSPSARPGGELAAGGDGVDTCFGDSGGPAFLITPGGDFLVGATSRGYAGAPPSEPCRYGGIYTRPDAVVDWIEAQVGPVEKPLCNQPPRPRAAPIEVPDGEVGSTVVELGDPDAHTGPVSYVLASAPLHGEATVAADGVVTYVADPGWTGPDRLVVAVDDGGNPDWPRTGASLAAEVEVPITVGRTAASAACGTVDGSAGLRRGAICAALVMLAGARRRRPPRSRPTPRPGLPPSRR